MIEINSKKPVAKSTKKELSFSLEDEYQNLFNAIDSENLGKIHFYEFSL